MPAERQDQQRPEQPEQAAQPGQAHGEGAPSVITMPKPGRQRRNRNELEFLPAALEIVETPPSPAGRAIAFTLAAFFVIALSWSWFGHVDIVAEAPGRIVPSDRTKVIQPLEAGVVRQILVSDGQPVKQGDVLVELDPTDSTADRARVDVELAAARLEVARLEALLAGTSDPVAAFKPPPDAAAAEISVARRLLDSAWREHRAMLAALDADYESKAADHAAIQSTIDMLEQTLPLMRERTESREYLAGRGMAARTASLELRQQLIEQEQSLTTQRHRRDEALAEIAAIDKRRGQAEAEFGRINLEALSEAHIRVSALTQELTKAVQRSGLQRLRAPVDGVVQQLAIHTVGGVVTSAQELMVIVPADARLEIEAMVANKDIGFVENGQEVEIKVETFAFTKYGLIDGTVLYLSTDAVADENLGLVYPTRVAMARTTMQVENKTVNLGPGMAVTAEIKTGQRRLIEYILAPLLRYKQESLRER